MTWLVERLAELRKHLDHLRMLEPKVEGPASLRDDLSLHNDVLFSLLTAAQLVIDIAGELGARRGLRFEDYTEAVRNLSAWEEFPQELVDRLARLPGFRNILIHEYVSLATTSRLSGRSGISSPSPSLPAVLPPSSNKSSSRIRRSPSATDRPRPTRCDSAKPSR